MCGMSFPSLAVTHTPQRGLTLTKFNVEVWVVSRGRARLPDPLEAGGWVSEDGGSHNTTHTHCNMSTRRMSVVRYTLLILHNLLNCGTLQSAVQFLQCSTVSAVQSNTADCIMTLTADTHLLHHILQSGDLQCQHPG